MSTEIRIEQMRLADKAAVLTFLREVYADNLRQSDERFWDWHFLENPYVETDNLPVWLAKSGEIVAGQLAAIPVRLKIGGAEKSAMWILDLIVREDFRRRGIAKKLVRAAEAFCPNGLGVNTMEQHAPALLQSLGWQIVAKIPRFSRVLFAGNSSREIAKFGLAREFANLVSAPLRPRAAKNVFGANGKIKILETFDDSFDDLWQECAAQFVCVVAREARFLEWQYLRQPGKKFEIIGFYENERLRGYVVMFFRKNGDKAAITDICYHPDNARETVDELLRAALQLAVARKTGVLVADALDALVAERLKKFGFWAVKSPLQLMVKIEQHDELPYRAGNWFLTRGDSDISIFEHPNL